MRTARSEAIRRWYDDNAARFEDAATIELAFIGMTPDQQHRLNRYKLWHLEQAGLIALAGKRVLEFGCGHGRMALEMPGWAEYVGLDFSAELVRLGQERLERAGLADRARLEVSDCMAFEAPLEHYDVVGSLGMFPSVDDPEAVLKKMVSHLRPGGVLFLDGYLSSPVYDPIRRLRWRIRKPTGGANRLDTERGVRGMFARAGLADMHFIGREYPLLGTAYARLGWSWPLALRNQLSRRQWLNIFATDYFAVGTKPISTAAQV
jgi:SAM-dependent methyltransferase